MRILFSLKFQNIWLVSSLFMTSFSCLFAQSNSGHKLLNTGYSKGEIRTAVKEYFYAQLEVEVNGYTLTENKVDEFIEKQLEFEEDLFKLKKYKTAWKSRPDLLDIFVYEKKQTKTESLSIRKNVIKDLAVLSKKYFPYVINLDSSDMVNRLENNFAGLDDKNIRDMSGLVNWLVSTTKNKKEIFPLSLEEKLEALKIIYPPSSMLPDSFNPNSYGIDTTLTDMKGLYRFIEDNMTEQINYMMLAFAYHNAYDGNISGQEINNIEVASWTLPTKSSMSMQSLKKYILEESSEITPKKVDAILEKICKDLSKYSNGKNQYQDKDGRLIVRMQEVPPLMSALRGNIGGDCSTSNSWLVPNIPTEHVFYLHSSKEEFIGYMTIVRGRYKSKNKPVIYLKDISGPKVSPKIIPTILESLDHLKLYFGAESLFLATEDWVDSQNPHEGIRDSLREFNQGKSTKIRLYEKTLETLDLDEFGDNNEHGGNEDNIKGSRRSEILSYDDPELHEEGVKYKPQKTIQSSVSIRYQSTSLEKLLHLEVESDPKLMIKNMKDYFSGKTTLEKIKFSKKLNRSEFYRGVDYLNNAEGYTVHQHLEHVRYLFGQYGIVISDKFINDHQEIFMRGFVNAKDGFKNRKYKTLSLKFLVEILRYSTPADLESVLKDNLNVINGSKTFFNHLKSYFLKSKLSGDRKFHLLLYLASSDVALAAEALFEEGMQKKVVYFLTHPDELEKKVKSNAGNAEDEVYTSRVKSNYEYIKHARAVFENREKILFKKHIEIVEETLDWLGLNLDVALETDIKYLLIEGFLNSSDFLKLSSKKYKHLVQEVLEEFLKNESVDKISRYFGSVSPLSLLSKKQVLTIESEVSSYLKSQDIRQNQSRKSKRIKYLLLFLVENGVKTFDSFLSGDGIVESLIVNGLDFRAKSFWAYYSVNKLKREPELTITQVNEILPALANRNFLDSDLRFTRYALEFFAKSRVGGKKVLKELLKTRDDDEDINSKVLALIGLIQRNDGKMKKSLKLKYNKYLGRQDSIDKDVYELLLDIARANSSSKCNQVFK